MTDKVDAHISELAYLETQKKGPGALWVREGDEPVYHTMEQIRPERFRHALSQTWEEAGKDGSERVFIVVADPQQLHLIRVPVEPADAGAVPPPTRKAAGGMPRIVRASDVG